ncbi:MAG: FprA family A-type flavoprotein [Planctomycetes bacterium]|nr:FprA family A-type flavoprotein [Planctomycetota bacterium]
MRALADNVYSVGVIDWDLKLFDRLIPLPDGTSYNSYVVKGSDKTALIDSVEPEHVDELIAHLVAAGIDKIDYLVALHGEQDHSGALPDMLVLYPDARVVTNPKCKSMLIDLLDLEDEQIITVEDREVLSLGDKTLEFVYTPWVHWPETMSVYLKEDRILFSCDLFGSHIATSDLFVSDKCQAYEPAKRYYAEIMMPYRKPVLNNIKKISDLDIAIIAPSHGPAYDDPKFIIDAYAEWAGGEVKNEVVIPYVSMHGSTKEMADYLADALIERGVTVKIFELAEVDIGKLAIALVDAATIVIGSPTVIVGPHPHAANAAFLTNLLRPKAKFASIIGSYGWGSKMVDQLCSMISGLKLDLIEPVVVKGAAKNEDFDALDVLADRIVEKHKEIGIFE